MGLSACSQEAVAYSDHSDLGFGWGFANRRSGLRHRAFHLCAVLTREDSRNLGLLPRLGRMPGDRR